MFLFLSLGQNMTKEVGKGPKPPSPASPFPRAGLNRGAREHKEDRKRLSFHSNHLTTQNQGTAEALSAQNHRRVDKLTMKVFFHLKILIADKLYEYLLCCSWEK